MTQGYDVDKWVDECARITRPAQVQWCDGGDAEYEKMIEDMVASGTLLPLNQRTHPGCYYHRSNPNDVAHGAPHVHLHHGKGGCRTNKQLDGSGGRQTTRDFDLEGCDEGQNNVRHSVHHGTGWFSVQSRGVQVTDSPYVAVNMHIMTRTGTAALEHIKKIGKFVPGFHSVADLNPDRRLILHFPEEQLVWSVGSGYGGNALLGKKCFALRLGSHIARQEGWMAEHMLIIGLEDPSGEVTYMAAAFPSASGKTNLAMLVSTLQIEGWRVWTIGDDIAWLHIDSEGQLRAVNPEAGFFGVAPGTSYKTNPVAMETIKSNTIYTNVALTKDMQPWWEGLEGDRPERLTDWMGNPYVGDGPAAHPNSRFTTPARQCPMISPRWEDPEGVPISAILFGSRRSAVVPLVVQSFSWQHGTYMGATMGAETTAAATGAIGVVRRDPMAMLPFCGYNMADYFRHWISMGARMKKPPLLFRVNWFRKGSDGRFLWPGYGENIRVLKWIHERVHGKDNVVETPIGLAPSSDALDMHGLNLSGQVLEELFAFDREGWLADAKSVKEFLNQFGDRMPEEIWTEYKDFVRRVESA